MHRVCRALGRAARPLRSGARRLRPNRAIMLIETGATSFGSMGDQAMSRGLAKRIADDLNRPVIFFSHSHDARWLDADGVSQVVSLPARGHLSRIRSLVRAVMLVERAIFIGGDVVDGKYAIGARWRVFMFLNAAGVPVTFAGFSYNAAPTAESLAFIHSMPRSTRFLLRDHHSLRRFDQLTGRSGELVADAAFLLEPNPAAADPDCLKKIAASREAGRVVVGFNVSNAVLPPVDQPLDLLAAALEAVLQDPAASLVLLPHDSRTDDSDVNLLNRLARRIDQHADRVTLAPMMKPGGVKHLAGQMDLVVTGRMHLAIAALGQGVPVLAFPYQDKFEGLFDHFDLPQDLCLDLRRVQDPARLSQFILAGIERHRALAARVRRTLPAVKALAAKNLPGETPDRGQTP